MKHIKNVYVFIMVLVTVWFIVSTVEVGTFNCYANHQYNELNMFSILCGMGV